MGPALDATTECTATRQSCDRCHRQKLRCKRPDENKEAHCERCVRKGVTCVYSSSLPKGRPSLYRLGDAPQTSRSSLSGPPNPPSTTTLTNPLTPPTSTTISESSDALGVSPQSLMMPTTPMHSSQAFGDVSIDPNLHAAGCAPPALAMSADAFADFWSPSWQHGHIDDDGMVGVVPHPALLGFDVEPALNHSNFARPSAALGPDGTFTSDGRAEHSPFNIDQLDFENTVVQLSQLSTRLSHLLGSSRDFLSSGAGGPDCSGTDPGRGVQLGIEAVFRSINTLLMRGVVPDDGRHNSSGGDGGDAHSRHHFPYRGGHADQVPATHPFDVLSHIFSASSQMLNILSRLCASVGAQGTTTAAATAEGHYCSSSVVHHLVVACVTLLLNMYVTILGALQRNADALCEREHSEARGGNGGAGPLDAPAMINGADLARLQLACVVQMCSYFVCRHDRVLERLVSGAPSLPPREAEGLLAAVGGLKSEVDERLRRLQQTLND